MRGALVAVLFSVSLLLGQTEGNARRIVSEYHEQISKAADAFEISPRMLAAILYAEHSSNVKFGEFILDNVLAQCGYNSSVGLGQIKVNTAMWIEQQLVDSTAAGFFRQRVVLIRPSRSLEELITRLNDPAINLLYAAAYIRMAQGLWKADIPRMSTERDSAQIFATLYSLGLTDSHGVVRRPHANPKFNEFGAKAARFYLDQELIRLFGEGRRK